VESKTICPDDSNSCYEIRQEFDRDDGLTRAVLRMNFARIVQKPQPKYFTLENANSSSVLIVAKMTSSFARDISQRCSERAVSIVANIGSQTYF
jgi:hypothetical protein